MIVPVSGKVVGERETEFLIAAAKDMHYTAGRFNDQFERELAKFVGARWALTTNSGSSANLLAVSALMSPALEEFALQPGDEVITCAVAFPTTVNPLLQCGLVPVFVDAQATTMNISTMAARSAITSNTKAIMVSHTLGNTCNMKTLKDLAIKNGLWLIEDCCDALGTTHNGQMVGTFGHISTFSFYPAHHITTGEGGAVMTSDPKLKRILESLRDWGRDCWCAPGKDNTCGKRFDGPYDHKYTYRELGYNLKMTDMQAALGCAQMERLPGFIETRKRNFALWNEMLSGLCWGITATNLPDTNPSWFGYPVTLYDNHRNDLMRYLDMHGVGVRPVFGGNIINQPYMKNQKFIVRGSLENADKIGSNALWLGVAPCVTQEMIEYAADKIKAFFSS